MPILQTPAHSQHWSWLLIHWEGEAEGEGWERGLELRRADPKDVLAYALEQRRGYRT